MGEFGRVLEISGDFKESLGEFGRVLEISGEFWRFQGVFREHSEFFEENSECSKIDQSIYLMRNQGIFSRIQKFLEEFKELKENFGDFKENSGEIIRIQKKK